MIKGPFSGVQEAVANKAARGTKRNDFLIINNRYGNEFSEYYKNTVKNNIKCCRLGAKFCVGCRWIQIAFKGYYWLVQMKMIELQEPMPAPGIEKPGADQQKLGSATAQKPSFKFHLIFHFFQQCMCYLKTCTLCETKYFVSQLSNV